MSAPFEVIASASVEMAPGVLGLRRPRPHRRISRGSRFDGHLRSVVTTQLGCEPRDLSVNRLRCEFTTAQLHPLRRLQPDHPALLVDDLQSQFPGPHVPGHGVRPWRGQERIETGPGEVQEHVGVGVLRDHTALKGPGYVLVGGTAGGVAEFVSDGLIPGAADPYVDCLGERASRPRPIRPQ